jgi:hypothetical protein
VTNVGDGQTNRICRSPDTADTDGGAQGEPRRLLPLKGDPADVMTIELNRTGRKQFAADSSRPGGRCQLVQDA